MENRNTFKKSERLKLTKKIDELFANGRWLRGNNIRLIYLETDDNLSSPSQVLFSVPKKIFRRAVKRNLLKRRMREAFRLNKNPFYSEVSTLNKKVYLGFIYSSSEEVEYSVINKEIRSLLAQVQSRLQKSSAF